MVKKIGSLLTSDYALGGIVAFVFLFILYTTRISETDGSYIYKFWNEIAKGDTLFAGFFTLLAARYAYLYSIKDKRDRSLNYANALKIELVRCLAVAKKVDEVLEAECININEIRFLYEQLSSHKSKFSKVDALALTPKIAKPIIICIDSVDIMVEHFSDYLAAEEQADRDYQRNIVAFIKLSAKSFRINYTKVSAFIKENEEK